MAEYHLMVVGTLEFASLLQCFRDSPQLIVKALLRGREQSRFVAVFHLEPLRGAVCATCIRIGTSAVIKIVLAGGLAGARCRVHADPIVGVVHELAQTERL